MNTTNIDRKMKKDTEIKLNLRSLKTIHCE